MENRVKKIYKVKAKNALKMYWGWNKNLKRRIRDLEAMFIVGNINQIIL